MSQNQNGISSRNLSQTFQSTLLRQVVPHVVAGRRAEAPGSPSTAAADRRRLAAPARAHVTRKNIGGNFKRVGGAAALPEEAVILLRGVVEAAAAAPADAAAAADGRASEGRLS